MEKIYRVGIESYGMYYEKFYLTLDSAQKAYEQLIEEKKKDPQTLKDEDLEEYGEGYDGKNFTETISSGVEHQGVKNLKRTFWSYEYKDSNECGTEYYSSTDHIVLQEISLERETEVAAVPPTDKSVGIPAARL